MIQYESRFIMHSDTELMHHGVKGMKWGVRKKYYSPTGGLTTRGKKAVSAYDRYSSTNDYMTKRNLYKKNKRYIKAGAKIRANQGNSKANKFALGNSAKKYAVGSAIVAGLSAVRIANTVKARRAGFKPGLINTGLTLGAIGLTTSLGAEAMRRKNLSEGRPANAHRSHF